MTELSVDVDLVAEMAVYNPFDFFLEPHAEQVPFTYDAAQRSELQPFLRRDPASPGFAKYVQQFGGRDCRTVDWLVQVNRQLQSDIRYLIRLEAGVQTIDRTLELRSGSCRDTSWLLVQMLRHLGLAARFVSGTCSARRARPAARCGTSIHRSSACRCSSPASPPTATSSR